MRPTCVTFLIISTILGWKPGLIVPKWACVAGPAIACAGNIILTTMTPSTSYWRFAFPGLTPHSWRIGYPFVYYLQMTVSVTPGHMQGLVSRVGQTSAQSRSCISFCSSVLIVGDAGSSDDVTALSKKYQDTSTLSMASYCVNILNSLIFIKARQRMDVDAQVAKAEESSTESLEEQIVSESDKISVV